MPSRYPLPAPWPLQEQHGDDSPGDREGMQSYEETEGEESDKQTSNDQIWT